MMDCNEDVRGETMTHFLDETGMKEIILQRHGSKAPGTYIDGQAPIDGIFTSCSLEAVKAGYTSFSDGVQGQRTDHRCLWVDIDVVAVFGNKTPPLLKFTGRRVQSRNPNIVKTFNKKYKEFAIKHRLAQGGAGYNIFWSFLTKIPLLDFMSILVIFRIILRQSP